MVQTLVRLEQPPRWVVDIFSEIDTQNFGPGFEHFTEETEMTFGTAVLQGVEAIKGFFVKIDSPLDIQHRIHDFWDGGSEKILRGDAILSKKGSTDPKITTPLMMIFYMADSLPEDAAQARVKEWFIVNGPIKTDAVI